MQDLMRGISEQRHSDSRGQLQAEPERSKANEDGSLVAKLLLSHPALALSDVLRQVPAATVQATRVTAEDNGHLMTFTVSGPNLDRFESALGTSSTVSNPLEIEQTTDGRVYRVELTDKTRWFTPELLRVGARPLDIEGAMGRWEVRGQFRSRAALSAFREHCREASITFTLNRLCWTTGHTTQSQFGLSSSQREVIEKAYQCGYFDVPRDISQRELADEFGISSSAVSQRLRRGVSQILAETVAGNDSSE